MRWLLLLVDRAAAQAWGFEGVTVSDYFAVNQLFAFHQIAADKEAAAAKALAAGLDVELPSTDCYGAPLRGST